MRDADWTLGAALAGAMLFGAVPALSEEYQSGDLVIDHPYAFETAPTARAGAGYMTISNGGGEAERLIAVEADFPRTEIHTTEVDDAGVARMMPVDAIEIPAGGSVRLEPRGHHVMFMGLSGPLLAGEGIEATLVFENAGRVEIRFDVEARNGEAMGDGHGEHGGH